MIKQIFCSTWCTWFPLGSDDRPFKRFLLEFDRGLGIVLGHVRNAGEVRKEAWTHQRCTIPTPLLFSIPRHWASTIEPARPDRYCHGYHRLYYPTLVCAKLPSSLFVLINDRRRVTRDNVVKSVLPIYHNRLGARQEGGSAEEVLRLQSPLVTHFFDPDLQNIFIYLNNIWGNVF